MLSALRCSQIRYKSIFQYIAPLNNHVVRTSHYKSQPNIPHYSNASCQQFHTTNGKLFSEDSKTTALAVVDNVKQVRHSPTAALFLGFSGLIPFVACPSYMISSGIFCPEIADAQLKYGAVILSFIGGIRWGLTLPMGSTQLPNFTNLGYSVLPSLIAWSGLLFSHTVGVLTVMTGLGFVGYMDMAMWGYPTWFKGMRFILTFVAVISLWTSLVCRFVLKDSDNKETAIVKPD